MSDCVSAPVATGTLMCTRMAKVSVLPQALLTLREQTRAFGQETRHALFKEDSWHRVKGRLDASEEHKKTAGGEKLPPSFSKIVQDMEAYLNPLLTQFDFSCLRPQAASLPVPEMTKGKDKEEKGSSVKLPAEPGEYMVILADRKLLELPLESLSILQQEGLNSVSRDFSLQLFYSRHKREERQKVESDNKKETKGGKGNKGKGDQSQAIKVIPANHALPSNTFPVDTRNFRYIVNPHNEGHTGAGGTSLSMRMKEILETHSQHFTNLWEGSEQTPSVSEMEQVLCRCSAFIYLGMEHLMAKIPPAKLAALNLSECHMALLFDRIQNNASILHQSMQKSAGQFALEKPMETALLLSLAGVGCIVLNQWHSSLQQNTHNMAAVLDNILQARQTCGQAVYALRKGNTSEIQQQAITGSCGTV
uniref:Uncharacterized protein n=1 Tax=Acanthochromis polyacanthus TaxID=80966 RepID=A0A3Q1GQD3_9TELE